MQGARVQQVLNSEASGSLAIEFYRFISSYKKQSALALFTGLIEMNKQRTNYIWEVIDSPSFSTLGVTRKSC